MTKTFRDKSQKEMSKEGFTLVELSLSIAFIAILSISVTLIITNSIASYHRGLTLNSINTTGMDLVDDMRAAVQNAPARPPVSYCSTIYRDSDSNNYYEECVNDQGSNFVSVSRRGNVKLGNRTIEGVPLFGAFCSGTYSYIWNSGYFFTNDADSKVNGVAKASFRYKFLKSSGELEDDVTKTNFKLLKVRDKNRDVCVSALNTNSSGVDNKRYLTNEKPINGGGSVFNVRGDDYAILAEEPIDILSGDIGNNLAIYDLTSMAPASSLSMNNAFYTVSFILGTIQGGINISASGNYCATPEGYESAIENFDYCAINKFNFAAQANGG
ncbi:hypothetical protein IKD98_01460 [Candidatus Saccharibacteria bacterium]|nr:hypothetical protein [Candidatus Saccharibacteria bacterium]